jgi:hypothetical protein
MCLLAPSGGIVRKLRKTVMPRWYRATVVGVMTIVREASIVPAWVSGHDPYNLRILPEPLSRVVL